MWFMDLIIEALSWVIQWLHDAAIYCWDSWYIPNGLGNVFSWLQGEVTIIGFQLIDLNAWLDNAAAWIGRILSYDNIASYFSAVFDAANAAWAWVWNAVSNVWSIVDDWWSGTWVNVRAWVSSTIDIAGDVIDSIYGWVNTVKDAIFNLIGRIPSIDEITQWFSNWWGNILGRIQDLGYLTANAISSLIDSELLDWLPFYDTLVELIDNPLDWLMDRVEYWFFDRQS